MHNPHRIGIVAWGVVVALALTLAWAIVGSAPAY